MLHVQTLVGPLKVVHISTQEKNEKCEYKPQISVDWFIIYLWYKPEGFSFQLEVQYNLEAAEALKVRSDKTFLRKKIFKVQNDI